MNFDKTKRKVESRNRKKKSTVGTQDGLDTLFQAHKRSTTTGDHNIKVQISGHNEDGQFHDSQGKFDTLREGQSPENNKSLK